MELGSQGHETNGINNKQAFFPKGIGEAEKVFNSESKGISAPHTSQTSSGESITPSINLTEVQGNNEILTSPTSFNLNTSALPTSNFSFPPLTRDLNSVPSETELLIETVDATNNLQDQFLDINEQGATFDDMVIVADGMVTSAPAPFSGEKIGTAEQHHSSTENLQDSASALSLTASEATIKPKDVAKSEFLQGEGDTEKTGTATTQGIDLPAALPMTVDKAAESTQENIVSKADIDSNDVTEKDIKSIKGQKVKKKFGKKCYVGVVADYDPETKWFKVVYEDEDQEELELWEVKAILASSDITPIMKKRPRTEGSANEEHQKSSKKPKKSGAEISVKSPRSGKSGKGKGKVGTPKQKTPRKGKSTTNNSSLKKKLRSPSSAKQQKSTKKRKSGGDNSTEPKTKRLKGAAKLGVSLETDISGEALVGRHVKKDFGGQFYDGVVLKFDRKTQYYKVKYEDGDQEDLELHELQPILIQERHELQSALMEKNHDLQAALGQEKHERQSPLMQENHDVLPVPEQEKHEIQPVLEQEKLEIQPVLKQEKCEIQSIVEQEKTEIQSIVEQEKPEIQPVLEQEKCEAQPVLEQETCKIRSVLEEVKHENQPLSEQERNEFQPVIVQEMSELQPTLSQNKGNPELAVMQEKQVLEPELVHEKPSIETVEQADAT